MRWPDVEDCDGKDENMYHGEEVLIVWMSFEGNSCEPLYPLRNERTKLSGFDDMRVDGSPTVLFRLCTKHEICLSHGPQATPSRTMGRRRGLGNMAIAPL